MTADQQHHLRSAANERRIGDAADGLESEARGHHRDQHRYGSHVEQLLASPFLNQVDRRER